MSVNVIMSSDDIKKKVFIKKKKNFDTDRHTHTMKKKSRPFSIKFRTHQKEYRAQLRCAYNPKSSLSGSIRSLFLCGLHLTT